MCSLAIKSDHCQALFPQGFEPPIGVERRCSNQGISGGYDATLEDFIEAVELARDGKIAVLCFHGVPDYYPHASTRPEDYAECMKYLHDEGYTVIALRDLAKYVDPENRPEDPYEPIQKRIAQIEAGAAAQK